MAIRNDILERKEEILQWISENQPKAEIARRLKCKPDTLNSYLEKMDIEYKGNMGKKGLKSSPNKKTFDELSQVSTVTSHKLRLRLLEEGIKEHKCECCGNTEWMGYPIPLELHHKDGNHFNNELSNLELLCPNCHAQTDNYSCKKKNVE